MRPIKFFLNSLMFKLFLNVIFIIGPLILVHIIYNYYAVDVTRNQVVQSNKNMLNIYIDQIDRSLDGASKYIFQMTQNNTDLYYLQNNETVDPNDYELAKTRLFNLITYQSYLYTAIDSVFIYSTANKDFINTGSSTETFLDHFKAKDEIRQLLETKPNMMPKGKWNIWKVGNQNYLLQYVEVDGVYVGAWVNMDKLITPFKYIDFGENGRALLATSDLTPITNMKFLNEEKIDLTVKGQKYTISGKGDRFVLMKEKSTQGDFYLIALIPEIEILEKLPYLQKISSIISISAVLFLFLFIFTMRKVFLQPIKQIVTAMRKLRGGDLEVRLPIRGNSTEFEVMNGTFNHMVSEIENLKINVYEEQLNLQRAELKHLQLQINPHFFLNSLNIIYNLATVKDYATIQEMAKCLANYFRFMFRSNSYFVSLEDEINHTGNYVKIQQLRFPEAINYSIKIPQELLKCKLPPLVIQTIVENSIKHAFNLDAPIEITIDIKKVVDDNSFLDIKIQDSGEGFPEEILQSLKMDEPITTEDGERIGLWNVKCRLNLIYQGNANIHFTNEEGKGATVHIRIPIYTI